MTAMREVTAPTRGSGPVHCCGGHRERCLFGQPHSWSTWYENGKLQRTPDTFHCHLCGGVCIADEDEPAATVSDATRNTDARWAELKASVKRDRDTNYTLACDYDDEGKAYQAERYFGHVEACDEILREMDRAES